MINNLGIAHFVHDSIYVDFAYDMFQMVVPESNDFYIALKNAKKQKLSHINRAPIQFISRFSCFNSSFIRSLRNYDIIIFHSMSPYKAEIASRLRGRSKIVWIGMGYDYYDLIYPSKLDMFKEETRNIYKSFEVNHNNSINRVKKIASKAVFRSAYDIKKLLSNIDYFAPVLEEEYHTISKHNPGVMPEYVDWNYDISSKLDNIEWEKYNNSENNILIGNSNAYTNNHIDAFNLIKRCNLPSDSKIICPLNYGGNRQYKAFILEIGKKYFGDRFCPLLSFVEFEQYIELLGTCSHAIMNHIRQQAGGNILIMLYLGAKVFLDNKNPFYAHFEQMGITFFPIEDLANDRQILMTRLEDDVKRNNRKLLKKFMNQNKSANQTRKLIETCLDRK